MNLLISIFSVAVVFASSLSCRDLLTKLERARDQRVSSQSLRGQLEDLYEKNPKLVLQGLLIEQATNPSADLETIVGDTVVKVRRALRRSKSN